MSEQGKQIVPIIRAGVMGWPVDHSLSPVVHGFWLDELGIDGSYERIAVAPENFEAELKSLAQKGYAGVNVTVPHKQAAMNAVDTCDAMAERIGAVNTIIVNPDGALHGFNTDGYGFIENLKAGVPDFDFSQKPCVVLGAGGAARAVVAALLDAGAPEVRIVNRTEANARQLAMDLAPYWDGDLAVAPWDARGDALDGAGLLVNTTTLGMQGKGALEISLDALPTDAVVNDIVYAPLETDLLAAAKVRGNTVVDGLGMLLHQARPGFAAWFGAEPQVSNALRSHVLDAIKGESE
ncbi:MAG: shikimate dehydrogenase [Rhodospirillaceae bacterium]|nr:shikimate dehydrogenase [Rhodospirillaceae bacterium]